MMDAMSKDRNVRKAITKESHWYFFHFYFAHYVTLPTADFQRDIIAFTENDNIKNLFIVAFRGSGKSTIITTSYPLWAVLGKQQKKFVIIFAQTRAQAKQYMSNLRSELEGNTLLKNDLGPFREDSDEWGSYSLVFSQLNARIMVASSEQGIRGMRDRQHRPDLIICDDVEDMLSVKTREGRDKTYNWLCGEVIPIGDKDTKLIVVGNLLHEDSLMMRLKKDVEEKKPNSIFKLYPLVNENGQIAWPGKYPTQEAIETERNKISNDIAWQREYLLRIVSDAGRVVHPEWIQYYNHGEEIPFKFQNLIGYFVGVDLAISQNETADCTAIVVLEAYRKDQECKAYVHRYPVNKRLTFPEQIQQIKTIACKLNKEATTRIFIENVGYQEALIQQLKHDGLHVEGVPVHGDKHGRLMMTTAAIQSGKILFPQKGAEELIMQLTGFGVEKHDDLVDAFSLAANQFIIHINKPIPGVMWI